MKITSGKIKKAQKVVIYGPEGVGKSTLASYFPNPIFDDVEGGTDELEVSRFEDRPTSWPMMLQRLDYIITNKPCSTYIIDTIDWAERLCLSYVCQLKNKNSITDFGYGEGFIQHEETFGKFLNRLQDVVDAGINVVLLAHAKIVKFEQPDELGAYDRWELKLGNKTTAKIASLVKEWADMVLFINYKTISVAVDDKGKKHKALGGQRVMYTSHHPCWDAKNRYGLPDELPLNYQAIASHIPNMLTIQPIVNNQPPYQQMPQQQGTIGDPTVKEAINATMKDLQNGQDAVQQMGINSNSIDLSGVPTALADLMRVNNITKEDIQVVASNRGHFPANTPFENFPQDYLNNFLVSHWDQVLNIINEIKATAQFD